MSDIPAPLTDPVPTTPAERRKLFDKYLKAMETVVPARLVYRIHPHYSSWCSIQTVRYGIYIPTSGQVGGPFSWLTYLTPQFGLKLYVSDRPGDNLWEPEGFPRTAPAIAETLNIPVEAVFNLVACKNSNDGKAVANAIRRHISFVTCNKKDRGMAGWLLKPFEAAYLVRCPVCHYFNYFNERSDNLLRSNHLCTNVH